jgi:hypothetical protein
MAHNKSEKQAMMIKAWNWEPNMSEHGILQGLKRWQNEMSRQIKNVEYRITR